MKSRPNARGKAPEFDENSRAKSNPNASEILPNSRPLWAMRGQSPLDPAATSPPAITSSEANPVHETDLAVYFTRRTLCQRLQISERSWSRAAALGLTPEPDIQIGPSARWSRSTIERWLRTKPRLPGRKGANHGQ